MVETTAILTFSLTVAVHRIKKPFVYVGFYNLNTDEHRHGFLNRKEHKEHKEKGLTLCALRVLCGSDIALNYINSAARL